MIASFKKKYVRVFLGISVLAMGNTFASGFEKAGDINVTATGGSKAIGRADHVTTDSLTQNQGGMGGSSSVNVVVGSPLTEPEKRPETYYTEGIIHISNNPPNWEVALPIFLHAANANPPHIDACFRCAEYFHNQNPSRVEDALHYYQRALSTTPGIKPPQGVYRGLMKLYHDAGKKSTRNKVQKNHLQKAKEYGEQISMPNHEDESMLNEIGQSLSQLNIIEEQPIKSVTAGVAIRTRVQQEIDSLCEVQKALSRIRGHESWGRNWRVAEQDDVGNVIRRLSSLQTKTDDQMIDGLRNEIRKLSEIQEALSRIRGHESWGRNWRVAEQDAVGNIMQRISQLI